LWAFLVHVERLAQTQSKKTGLAVRREGIQGLDEYYAHPIVMQRALLKMNGSVSSDSGKHAVEYLQDQQVRDQQKTVYKQNVREEIEHAEQNRREVIVQHTPGPKYEPLFSDKRKLAEDRKKRLHEKLQNTPEVIVQQKEIL